MFTPVVTDVVVKAPSGEVTAASVIVPFSGNVTEAASLLNF